MKKHLLTLIVITCFLTNQANAQALWGAEAVTGQGDGQFDSDFTQSEDPNNLAISGWTALTVFDNGTNNIPGNAYWIRNLLGYSQGAYWGGTTPANSPSQANGIAIFDSDYLDNNGNPGAFGNGSSPSPHRGELISPAIDLTGYTDELIMLKLFSHYRDFDIDELSVSVSVDAGASWGQVVDYRQYQPELTEGFIYVPLPASTLAGVNNLSQVRIKFVFDGDYYFALVDDVTLMIYDEVYFDILFKDGFDSQTN